MATINKNCIDNIDDLDYVEDGEPITLNRSELETPTDTLKNPFFIGCSGSELSQMSDKDIYMSYKRIFVLCLNNDVKKNTVLINLKDLYISSSDEFWTQLKNDTTLCQGSMKLLKIKHTKKTTVIVKKEFLEKLNDTIKFEDTELVTVMLNIKQEHIDDYLSLFDGFYSFDAYQKLKLLASSFDCEWYDPVKANLNEILSNLKESSYWKLPLNCSLNMNKPFLERVMEFSNVNENSDMKASTRVHKFNENQSVIELVKKLQQKPRQLNSYMKFVSKSQDHVDASKAIEGSKGYKLYYIPSESKKDSFVDMRNIITDIFTTSTSNKEKMLLFTSLAVSKDYWHLVLNNKHVLETLKPVFSQYLPVARYVIGYPFLMAYLEECVKKGYSSYDDRHVFDIDTASKLPFFPFVNDVDPHLNPYSPILVSKKLLSPDINILGLRMLKNYNDYGIADLETFKYNFNMMTTFTKEHSIFDGLDWKKNNIQITGSCIMACAQKKSPLLKLMKGSTDEEKLKLYFNTYYKNDIDIMHYSKSVFDFMDVVLDIHKTVQQNATNRIDSIAKVSIEPVKDIIIHVTSKYLELMEELEHDFSAEYVIKNINSIEVLSEFYAKYVAAKMINNKKLSKLHPREKNSLYVNFYDDLKSPKEIDLYVTTTINDAGSDFDNEIRFYYNDIVSDDKKVSDDENVLVMRIAENIKFKFSSVHLPYKIELFRRKFSDPFSTVSKFHLGSVRGYYNGSNVYLLPSCVGSLLSFMNIDYKYFAGRRTPLQIFAKYRSRGVGVYLNDQERANMLEYLQVADDWKDMYKIDPKNKDSVESVSGSHTLDSEIFKQSKYIGEFKGLSDDVLFSKIEKEEYMYSLEDYDKYLSEKGFNCHGLNWNKFKTINDEGSVSPFSMDFVRLGMEIIDNK